MRSWVAPVVVFGAIPQYCIAHNTWRCLKMIVPRRLYDTVDEFMYDSYQTLITFFYESFNCTQVYFYGDQLPTDKKENVIYISNHQAAIDWVISDFVAIRQGSTGRLRYIMKMFFKYFPWYGPYFYQRGCIFVNRGGKDSDEAIRRDLRQFQRDRVGGYWLVIFPEGTRYSTSKPDAFEKSRDFAKAKGLTPYNNVLFPRSRAFQFALTELRESLDAVYDLTIGYKIPWLPSLPRRDGPSILQFLALQGQEIHIHVRRIPIEEMPRDEALQKKWLYSAFERKDKLMQDFLDESVEPLFPGKQYEIPLKKRKVLSHVLFYSLLLGFSLSSAETRKWYARSWIATFCGSMIGAPLFYRFLN